MVKRQVCEVTENRVVAKDTVQLSFRFDAELAGGIIPGQFMHIASTGRPDLPLRRPFGINGYNADTRIMRIVIQQVGAGSTAISAARAGDRLDVFGPAGNGFPTPPARVWLVGGGMGCSPLNFLPEFYPDTEFTPIYGFRNKGQIYQLDEMMAACEQLVLLTDDGSAGQKGFVNDAVEAKLQEGERPDAIYACGPTPMLTGLQNLLEKMDAKLPCYVSLEQRMGCGMGACYTCTCDTTAQGKKANARVCLEGPVFEIGEVLFHG